MHMHDGHRERLRARFLREGLQGFEEHSALEMLLFYARPRCDTNGIAHALIKRFGSFAAVFDAPLEALEQVEGVGHTTAVLLKLITPMGAYYLENRTRPGTVLDTAEKAGSFFLPKFLGKKGEEVYCATLNNKRGLLQTACIARDGSVNAVAVPVKRVVAEALSADAASVLIAHNHPGGVALPSAGDRAFTRKLFQALQMVNVQLADHIIIADNEYFSMANSGFIAELALEPPL